MLRRLLACQPSSFADDPTVAGAQSCADPLGFEPWPPMPYHVLRAHHLERRRQQSKRDSDFDSEETWSRASWGSAFDDDSNGGDDDDQDDDEEGHIVRSQVPNICIVLSCWLFSMICRLGRVR